MAAKLGCSYHKALYKTTEAPGYMLSFTHGNTNLKFKKKMSIYARNSFGILKKLSNNRFAPYY